ncbi:MAG: NUDIX hydrolase [Enterococcus lacertideformus]|uniref:NUDIX hydrolase n=1 Tax=Enterococcus lacertideformus TaxID=2771493 RepID=A0A931AWY5_9ENTE|nr:NUDIX hydrolase [Enterococcus lacertideformus]
MVTRLSDYRRLLAISQAGLLYGNDVFDKERYEELQEISLKLLSEVSLETKEEWGSLFEPHEGYPTPKVDVRAYIKKGEAILLIEDKKTQEWALPGGFAEVGLSPKENMQKEVKEETGLTVAVNQLLAVFDTNLRPDIPQAFQYYKLIFSCEILSGDFIENNETSNMKFFQLNKLPKLSLKRTTEEQLMLLDKVTLTYCD